MKSDNFALPLNPLSWYNCLKVEDNTDISVWDISSLRTLKKVFNFPILERTNVSIWLSCSLFSVKTSDVVSLSVSSSFSNTSSEKISNGLILIF